VYAILLGCAGLLLFLALASFTRGHREQDWIGIAGYAVAWVLLRGLGLGAYLIIPLLAWLGVWLIRRHEWPDWLLLGSAGGGLMLFPVLVRLLAPRAMLQGVKLSGGVGEWVGELVFRPLLGTVGATVLVTVLLVAVVLILKGDPVEVWRERLGSWWQAFAGLFARGDRRSDWREPAPTRRNEPVISQRQPVADEETEPAPDQPPEQTPAPRPRPRKGKAEPEPVIVEHQAMRRSLDVSEHRPAQEAPEATPLPEEEGPPKAWEFPATTFLNYEPPKQTGIMKELLKEQAQHLTETLKDYGIEGKVTAINPGPVITMFEYLPERGIKISKIASLDDDLTMALKALKVRIVAPIPGKGVVGIEVPNPSRETVYLKEVLLSDEFRNSSSKLTVCLGKDIFGGPVVADLAKMPHLLVAGATGSGKSVGVNAFIVSILYKARPEDVKMILIDPKMLELSVYQGIPHLMTPVVTDMKQAAIVLRWAVSEMERRYKLMSQLGVRNIDHYNSTLEQMAADPNRVHDEEDLKFDHFPYLLLVIDEFADLMTVAAKEVETSVVRIAQMARAAGIHIIMATQRPSVDVITGVIKANLPTRVAFQVASKVDSRTILDTNGAENLLGMGDMLYMPPGTSGLKRVHGAFVTTEEIHRVVTHLKTQGKPRYDLTLLEEPKKEDGGGAIEPEEQDELYRQALDVVREKGDASISYLQRRLKIGYNRAARMIERMEREGIVGPASGPGGTREVYLNQL
jgi:S-DNA-T family DNA segregation ATPase FtsK/SpoIIIE